MRLAYHTTYECAARPETVRAVLLNPNHWSSLLPNLERLGNYWCYGQELYELHVHSIGEGVVIQAVCLAPRRSWTVTFHFEDTIITTRLVVDVVADLAPSLWWAVRRAVAAQVAQSCMLLAALLDAQTPPLPTPPVVPEQIDAVAARYPNTVAAFASMNALDHLERIVRLDGVWQQIRQATANKGRPSGAAQSPVYNLQSSISHQPQYRYDLIYAGGGLALLHAAVMAQRYNKKVLLFDRGEVGCAHREWNISRIELEALVAIGLFTWDELHDVVMNEYERGIVRFHSRETPVDLWLPTVLNVALDAGMLLQRARRKLEQAGGTILDHRVFKQVSVSSTNPVEVCVEVQAPHGISESYHGRLLLDGMGSTSPLAMERFAGQPFAGVCPTVGTVVSGLAEGDAPNQHNPHVGDILLSIDHAQRNQQYMWEGFPGRGDELTVYLFYYDTLQKNQEQRTKNRENVSQHGSQFTVLGSPSLMQLFEDYFTLLPTYKQPGPDFRHLKPVYGYIPARHSLRRQEAPLLRGVLPIGDSAAQQSPLTFCGFGSHVRNLQRTTSLLDVALNHDLLEPEQVYTISAYQTNVSLNWVFSRFMQPWQRPEDVNRLQNVFLGVLNELGIDLAQRFFQDRMRWGDYHKMVLGMFAAHPPIVLDAWQVLGPRGCQQWAADYGRYSGAALLAWAAQYLGQSGRHTLIERLEQVHPAAALRVRAAFAEWHASGWLAFDEI